MTTPSWDTHPLAGWRCRLFTALVLVFVVVPQVDLGVSALFYDAGTGLFVAEGPILNAIRKGVPPLLYAAVVFVVLLWVGDRMVPGPRRGRPSGRQVLFLVGSLALGPGLIVNGVLKEWWGRARPSDIEAFGGAAIYTPPWMIADQCATNCSFVSGHAAIGFWVVAFALLVPRRHRVPAMIAALLFGAIVGGARIVVGAHFLSDIVFAGVIVIAVTLWLHRTLILDDG
ncbi:phosphatase PAP2 family protein [Roseospira goensis]|uniref:Lipid A 4'-phosphatase n=1 Tax=Roseospira goensis TaxID=391922 RepID=A0A7W6RXF6_9PROT|nr:phosphatase PAP2 family protein [Roseospira goensis]MBB4285005.1 lipid A 4'-phosphatase [Roseospira goensis]